MWAKVYILEGKKKNPDTLHRPFYGRALAEHFRQHAIQVYKYIYKQETDIKEKKRENKNVSIYNTYGVHCSHNYKGKYGCYIVHIRINLQKYRR